MNKVTETSTVKYMVVSTGVCDRKYPVLPVVVISSFIVFHVVVKPFAIYILVVSTILVLWNKIIWTSLMTFLFFFRSFCSLFSNKYDLRTEHKSPALPLNPLKHVSTLRWLVSMADIVHFCISVPFVTCVGSHFVFGDKAHCNVRYKGRGCMRTHVLLEELGCIACDSLWLECQ